MGRPLPRTLADRSEFYFGLEDGFIDLLAGCEDGDRFDFHVHRALTRALRTIHRDRSDIEGPLHVVGFARSFRPVPGGVEYGNEYLVEVRYDRSGHLATYGSTHRWGGPTTGAPRFTCYAD